MTDAPDSEDVATVRLRPAVLATAAYGFLVTALALALLIAVFPRPPSMPAPMRITFWLLAAFSLALFLPVLHLSLCWDVGRSGIRHAVLSFIHIKWQSIHWVSRLMPPGHIISCSLWVFPHLYLEVPARYMLANRHQTCQHLLHLYGALKDTLPPQAIKFFRLYCGREIIRADNQEGKPPVGLP